MQPAAGATIADGVDLAIDTDSRRLPAAEAAQRAIDAHASAGHGRRLYKKIDSTLRGHWAAEVAALVPRAGPALVAPAHPVLGRTVRDGRVLVHGVPLEQTDTWQLEHRHRPADIARQLRDAGLAVAASPVKATGDRQELAARIARLLEQKVDAVVFDAESVDDLRCMAGAGRSLARRTFWVGSGGLAREIAALLPAGKAEAASVPPRASGPTLIVAGSLSAVTDRQVQLLGRQDGVHTVVAPPHVLREGASRDGWKTLQSAIDARLGAGCDLLLTIGRDARIDPSEGPRLCTALARLVAPAWERIGGLIATGGETARAVLVESGVEVMCLLDEPEPGVVIGIPSGTVRRHPWVVTKAGAFGHDETLLNACRALRAAAAGAPAVAPAAADRLRTDPSSLEEHR